jgi:hypothetical protein
LIIIVLVSEISMGEKLIKYEFIPDLCKKFKVEKNLINPIYSG